MKLVETREGCSFEVREQKSKEVNKLDRACAKQRKKQKKEVRRENHNTEGASSAKGYETGQANCVSCARKISPHALACACGM